MIEMFQHAGINDALYPEAFVDMRDALVSAEQAGMDEIARNCYDAMDQAKKHVLPSGNVVWATSPVAYETQSGTEVAVWMFADKQPYDRFYGLRGQDGDRTISLAINDHWDTPLAFIVPANALGGSTVLIAGEALPIGEQFDVLQQMTLAVRNQEAYRQPHPVSLQGIRVPVRELVISRRDKQMVMDAITINTSMQRLGKLSESIYPYIVKGADRHHNTVKKELERLHGHIVRSPDYGPEDFMAIVKRLSLEDVLVAGSDHDPYTRYLHKRTG